MVRSLGVIQEILRKYYNIIIFFCSTSCKRRPVFMFNSTWSHNCNKLESTRPTIFSMFFKFFKS